MTDAAIKKQLQAAEPESYAWAVQSGFSKPHGFKSHGTRRSFLDHLRQTREQIADERPDYNRQVRKLRIALAKIDGREPCPICVECEAHPDREPAAFNVATAARTFGVETEIVLEPIDKTPSTDPQEIRIKVRHETVGAWHGIPASNAAAGILEFPRTAWRIKP